MRFNFILVILFFLLKSSFAQVGDDILGKYKLIDEKLEKAGKEMFMTFTKNEKGEYEGRMAVPKGADRESAKDGKVATLITITKLVFDKKTKEWVNGEIRSDARDRSIKVKISKTGPGKYQARCYIGLPAFGKTIYWERAN